MITKNLILKIEKFNKICCKNTTLFKILNKISKNNSVFQKMIKIPCLLLIIKLI